MLRYFQLLTDINRANFCLGQDLIQHNSGSSDMNSSLRLTAPTINSQSTGATLTISNDQLLSQGTSLNAPGMHKMIF